MINIQYDNNTTYINNIIEDSKILLLFEIINQKIKTYQNILYIAKDESSVKNITKNIGFFSDIDIIEFPDWNIMPYDRISPSSYIMATRIESLYKMINSSKNKLIITTANSLIQKTIPRDFLSKQIFHIKKNDHVNRDYLMDFLTISGYNRVNTVREIGEFAIRGEIIDIFSVDENFGHRLDFFANKIENIRIFDPISQISKSQIEDIIIKPVSEIIFNKEHINNFRENFLKIFGVKCTKNNIYNSIVNNKYCIGIENWLPLFYNKLDNLFNFIENPLIIFEHSSREMINDQYKNIYNQYDLRIKKLSTNKINDNEEYLPISPEKLWIDRYDIEKIIQDKEKIFLTSFKSEKDSDDYNIKYLPNFIAESKLLSKTMLEVIKDFSSSKENLKNNKRLKIIIVYSVNSSKNRIIELLEAQDQHYVLTNFWHEAKNISSKSIAVAPLAIDHGFIYENFMIISEQDLFGEKIYKKNNSRKRLENFLNEAASLENGEIIVHKDHGIGKFENLETIHVSNTNHDCLKIIYRDGDRLYLPVENIDLITKYGTSENVILDKLGNANWYARKAKLKDKIKVAAIEFLKIAAERELKSANILVPNQELYNEFCARFPYVETEDQLNSIKEIEEDLSSGKAMDRLICGDVGFGKTEIALRAIFIAVKSELHTAENRPQIAIIAPTTILAKQHYKSLNERFTGFDVNIAQLSRLTSRLESNKIKSRIKEGEIDIVVGTHALLAKDIEFKNLVLIIVDEEQHFGVVQKERLKKLKSNVHILTLSATPIPRTLQMSLTGIKDLSIVATPPVDRTAVKTFILPYDPVIIREAILREFNRQGKIFYVVPKIIDMENVEKELKILVPEIKIAVAHGQMPSSKLDDIMNDFYEGKYNLLLSTTIIESGLDVPSANTIIIHRADTLGLSQLYQLRGRVGRGKIKAYAYLNIPSDKLLKAKTDKRLRIMQTLDNLGAGFTLASHDMDIRGFGNLVGEEQSGHIKEVGVELYQHMLKEAILEIKEKTIESKEINEDFTPQINIGLSILIPEIYVNDLSLRLGLYRRVASLDTDLDIDNFKLEMIDRFGPIPIEFENLLLIVKLKKLCKLLMVNKIDAGPKGVILGFHNNQLENSEKILEYALKNPNKLKIRADNKIILMIQTEDLNSRYSLIKNSLNNILKIINS